MTKDEALKLALETLESSRVFVMSREMIKQPEGADWYDNRITAIKEALAQPVQEPVAWVSEDVCNGQFINGRPRKIWWECSKGVGTAFYTTPPLPVQEPVAWEQFYEHLVERNFCQRCGKRTADLTTIHTCTPPRENT